MNNISQIHRGNFHSLKIAKKQKTAKNTFVFEFAIPAELANNFEFRAGQFVTVKFEHHCETVYNDYSIATAPYERKLEIAVKVNSENGSSASFCHKYNVGDEIEVSEPAGRFILEKKPHEFRTIIGFAAGIGITPIFSHFKNILHTEPRTRLFLFYGNRSSEETVFRDELNNLAKQSNGRLQVFYFNSGLADNSLFSGRLDEKKLQLIINQILHLDDTDEESTIWDAVDEVLICGRGEMIKSLANACLKNGIPKKNIHFELFESFNDDIYPQEKEFPLIENIETDFKFNGKNYSAQVPDNKTRILQQLLQQGFPVPYSCKSGICGSCICQLEEGNVELLENEFLTEKEFSEGKILACMAIPVSKKIKLNFDLL